MIKIKSYLVKNLKLNKINLIKKEFKNKKIIFIIYV